jgi:hypothetical protein
MGWSDRLSLRISENANFGLQMLAISWNFFFLAASWPLDGRNVKESDWNAESCRIKRVMRVGFEPTPPERPDLLDRSYPGRSLVWRLGPLGHLTDISQG